jgi:two-component system, OmpR family, sensor histidine kinase KdpD
MRILSEGRRSATSFSRGAALAHMGREWPSEKYDRPIVQTLWRAIVVITAVALLTAFDFRILHVNSATAGFTYLILILALATRVGLRESITASIVSVTTYNFFFLPPIGTFTISDPQNWIALCAFLATAITASHLSSRVRKTADEARAGQEEVQQMYDFSRGLMLGPGESSLSNQVVRQVVESFHLNDASFYESSTGTISKFESDFVFSDAVLSEVSKTGRIWRGADGALVVPVSLGGPTLGSLGVAGESIPSEIALKAVAQLVAIAIERARAQAVSARMEAAQQSEQLKSTLLDALAHEFKTPLTAVKAATTTLLSFRALKVAQQYELLTIIDEEADRMNRLVSDSIDLVRLGSAPVILNREVCSIERIISSALDDVRALADGRRLKLEFSPDLPPVKADISLSELALRQLLNNALKYSPPKTTVRISACRLEKLVVVKVSNTGPGIAKEDQERIFEKFYRGPDVRTRVAGTGMGLNIARAITQAQGGSISVESDLGEGATFSMTFPVAESAEAKSYSPRWAL